MRAPVRDWCQYLKQKNVDQSFIVASTFRSGSTYVAEILGRSSGLLGLTKEYLSDFAKLPPLDRFDVNVKALADVSIDADRRNILATKLMWSHRNEIARVLGLHRSEATLFRDIFPSAEWILVTRKDVFAQAVSFWRAKQSGRWHVYQKGPEPRIPYDFADIDACLREIVTHGLLWRDFFRKSGIVPVEIIYEDLVAGGEPYLRSALKGTRIETLISRYVLAVPLVRQSDTYSIETRERFLDDLYKTGK